LLNFVEAVGELEGTIRSSIWWAKVSPDGPAIGLDGLALQTLELQVFQVRLVLMIKVLWGGRIHAGLSSRDIAKSPPQK
jgi:hypothetical protein